MATSTQVAVGTIFTVPRKSPFTGEVEVVEYRVTAVRNGFIHYRSTDSYNRPFKRAIAQGLRPDAVIVSVPDEAAKAAKPSNPKLGKREIDALYKRAHEAGIDAGVAKIPTPIVVERHANPLNDASPVVQSWFVPQGLCGFASIKFPANTAFAKRLIEKGHAHKSSGTGAYIWVGEFGQSVEQKEAYAQAFAKVLREAGIQKVYAESRLD